MVDSLRDPRRAPRRGRGGRGGAGIVDARTLDQVRADRFADMLLMGAPAIDPTRDALSGGLGAIRARVQVTIPVSTLATALGNLACFRRRHHTMKHATDWTVLQAVAPIGRIRRPVSCSCPTTHRRSEA